ncbi:MAG: acyltransferase family protein [Candidatus Melainabacteria bacterium]|nr:acyltransferase family protein [Candidatus Melainabacteria bacterium]
MVSWTNLKALAPGDPLQALARRCPAYYNRYAGVVDQFGFALETFARWEPIFRFLFEDYFHVKVQGIENIPGEGRAILVGNHSGLLPLDGAMIAMAMCHWHPSPRRIRFLATDWFFSIPGVGDWIKETGQVRASLENAKILLDKNELVGIYPEGLRGVGKTFPERYRVIDFHPGFVQLAIATQTPLIQVATVGGDEIFPNFANIKLLSQLLRMPFFPVTLGFPWLPFPLMFLPLPVRWLINIHKPIDLGYPPEKASDRKLVLRIAREIQYDIQRNLNTLLRERKNLFTECDN